MSHFRASYGAISRGTHITDKFPRNAEQLFISVFIAFFSTERGGEYVQICMRNRMEDRMLKLTTIAIVTALAMPMAAPVALAGPAERLERFDNRLDRLERRGVIEQGSYLDRVEDRIDRFENKVDRREDRRDRAVNHGPRDRAEDRLDRLENIQDRREDRRDRINLY